MSKDEILQILDHLSEKNIGKLLAFLKDLEMKKDSKISLSTLLETKDTSWKALFGAFTIDESADEFVNELKKDRVFNHKSIDL